MNKTWLAVAFLVAFIPGAANGLWLTGFWKLSPGQILTLDLMQFVLIPAVVAILLFRSPAIRSGLPKLNWPTQPAAIAQSLAIGVVTGVVALALIKIVGATLASQLDLSHTPGGLLPLYSLFPSGETAALYIAVTAAITEEFVFRYLPLAYLAPAEVSDRGKWLRYLSVACVLFGVAHWEYGTQGVIESALYGLLFAFMFWAFRNPVTIVVAHFTADLILYWPKGLL